MTKWDERYQTEDYIFGTEPNEFIARIQSYLPTSGEHWIWLPEKGVMVSF